MKVFEKREENRRKLQKDIIDRLVSWTSLGKDVKFIGTLDRMEKFSE